MKSLGTDSQSTDYTNVWLMNDLHIVLFVYRHCKYHWPVGPESTVKKKKKKSVSQNSDNEAQCQATEDYGIESETLEVSGGLDSSTSQWDGCGNSKSRRRDGARRNQFGQARRSGGTGCNRQQKVEYLCLGYGASVESMQTNKLNLNLISRPPLQSVGPHPRYKYVGSRSWESTGTHTLITIVEILLIARKKSSWRCCIHPLFNFYYWMRSISKPEVRVLTGRDCDPRYVGVDCVSGLAYSTDRRAILLRIPQQVTSRWQETEADIWSIMNTNHSSFCGIVKYHPKIPTDGCFICSVK